MANSALIEFAERKRHSSFSVFFKRLIREKPIGAVGGVITLTLLLTGIFCEFLAPYGMNETCAGDFLSPPSAQFWLGTDNLGRDILSRIIYGARISVIVGLAGSVVATLLSSIIGVVSGYIGGKLDLIVQRGIDIWMSLPSLITLMVLVTILRPSIWSLIISLGFTIGISGSRVVRGAVINIKDKLYLEAAKGIGCSSAHIIIRHILPNVMVTIIILFSVRVPNVILMEASLSFLGFGLPPPAPSWGAMLSGSGRTYMFMAPWMAFWPGLALAIVVYGVNMFGDAVRDLLDPRLRGGAGRLGGGIQKREIKTGSVSQDVGKKPEKQVLEKYSRDVF